MMKYYAKAWSDIVERSGYQMDFSILPVEAEDLKQYKADLQEAFQKGYEDQFGKTDELILPEEDIEQSLHSKGAAAYKAVVDGEMAGGAVVVIDEKTQHNYLAFLYVKYGMQGKGVGKKLWFGIEKLYPETKVWETCTPCFEKRNVHFYVNVCGFHIVSSFRDPLPMPSHLDKMPDDGSDDMYELWKQM